MAAQKHPKARKTKAMKDSEVRFRISTVDKAALVAAAERDGLDLSSWVRRLALRAAGVLPEPQK